MEKFVGAAVGFPTIFFSATPLGFWLLVELGATESDRFDSDAGFGAVRPGGVPATVAAPFTMAFAMTFGWFLTLASSLIIGRSGITGRAHTVTDNPFLLLSLPVARRVTRGVVRPSVKLFPDEPGPSPQETSSVRLASSATGGWTQGSVKRKPPRATAQPPSYRPGRPVRIP